MLNKLLLHRQSTFNTAQKLKTARTPQQVPTHFKKYFDHLTPERKCFFHTGALAGRNGFHCSCACGTWMSSADGIGALSSGSAHVGCALRTGFGCSIRSHVLPLHTAKQAIGPPHIRPRKTCQKEKQRDAVERCTTGRVRQKPSCRPAQDPPSCS